MEIARVSLSFLPLAVRMARTGILRVFVFSPLGFGRKMRCDMRSRRVAARKYPFSRNVASAATISKSSGSVQTGVGIFIEVGVGILGLEPSDRTMPCVAFSQSSRRAQNCGLSPYFLENVNKFTRNALVVIRTIAVARCCDVMRCDVTQ